jgi:NADH-quinone oxidoreductase subunit M
VLAVLAVAVLWLGLHPKPLTDVMAPSVQQLVQQVTASKLP